MSVPCAWNTIWPLRGDAWLCESFLWPTLKWKVCLRVVLEEFLLYLKKRAQISQPGRCSSIFNIPACCYFIKILSGAVNECMFLESILHYQMHLLESLLCGPVLSAPPPIPTTCHHSVDQQQQHGMYHPPQTPPWHPTKGGWSTHKDICILASH